MKLILTRSSGERTGLNKWLIFAIVLFAVVALAVYYASSKANSAQQLQQVQILNQECALYGQQLTSELASNSTACTSLNSSITPSNVTDVACGSVLYCSYSYSCASHKPVTANTLNCLCTVLKNNKVILPGLCVKQLLSNAS